MSASAFLLAADAVSDPRLPEFLNGRPKLYTFGPAWAAEDVQLSTTSLYQDLVVRDLPRACRHLVGLARAQLRDKPGAAKAITAALDRAAQEPTCAKGSSSRATPSARACFTQSPSAEAVRSRSRAT
jgi:hypothetical protein